MRDRASGCRILPEFRKRGGRRRASPIARNGLKCSVIIIKMRFRWIKRLAARRLELDPFSPFVSSLFLPLLFLLVSFAFRSIVASSRFKRVTWVAFACSFHTSYHVGRFCVCACGFGCLGGSPSRMMPRLSPYFFSLYWVPCSLHFRKECYTRAQVSDRKLNDQTRVFFC